VPDFRFFTCTRPYADVFRTQRIGLPHTLQVTTLLHDSHSPLTLEFEGSLRRFESFPWTLDILYSTAVYSKVNLNCDVPSCPNLGSGMQNFR